LLIETHTLEVDQSYCASHADAKPGRYVLLSISDNGSGMDAATMNHLFEPFFTTKEPGKGTGLGLATVLGIVKQHEGWVEVSSELAKGSVFRVFLPASEGPAEAREQAQSAPVRGGSETILAAEDHDAIRETVEKTLGGLGYRVILARDGEEAVQRFEANRNDISLLLLDVAMPRLSGADAYARISRIKRGVPVIFTSGNPDERVLLASTAAEGAPILQKPYGSKVLAQMVRELLDRAAIETPRPGSE
jgi:two-component system cell cycle sensor histidine kinase/response regulator CckA